MKTFATDLPRGNPFVNTVITNSISISCGPSNERLRLRWTM